MTSVALTGCAGSFARVLLPLLENDPHIEQIIGIDRVAPEQKYTKLKFYSYDIRDQAIAEVLKGCDTLIHLAFIVGRPFSMSLQEAASVNLAGTWNICRAAADVGVRKLVISSSIAAYGDLPDNPEWLTEESPLRGLYTDFYYSQHKHANEIWLDGLQLAFPKLLISRLRPSIVIGPRQAASRIIIHPNNTHFTSQRAYEGRFQFVHEDDLAAAFHTMVKHDLPGAYNVVGDGAAALPTLAAQAGLLVIEVPEEILLQQVTLSWQQGMSGLGPEWAKTDGLLACSNEKLKATGLWIPLYTTVQALAATAAALEG